MFLGDDVSRISKTFCSLHQGDGEETRPLARRPFTLDIENFAVFYTFVRDRWAIPVASIRDGESHARYRLQQISPTSVR